MGQTVPAGSGTGQGHITVICAGPVGITQTTKMLAIQVPPWHHRQGLLQQQTLLTAMNSEVQALHDEG